MILNSTKNLQVSGITESEDEKLYFRAFVDDKSGITITNQTYIFEKIRKEEFRIIRIIEDEIVSLLINKKDLVAISKFGNVYIMEINGNKWKDYTIKFKPVEYIFKSIIHKNIVYSVSTGGNLFKYDKGQWKTLAKDIGNDDLDLIGICNEKNNSFLVCGENGILASVMKGKDAKLVSIPTDKYLLDIEKISDTSYAVCGQKGSLFIGVGNNWDNYCKMDYNTNFTSMAYWQNQLYISANDKVLIFVDGEYSIHTNIPSLNLVGLKNELWSIGLKKLKKFNGTNWENVVVEIKI